MAISRLIHFAFRLFVTTGTLDPTKVGSGVQMGEVKASGGITLDDNQSSSADEGGCKC